MPRNGLGQYVRPYNWTDDRNNGIKILASRVDGQDDDFGSALTNSIATDGQSLVTGPIPFASQKITLLGTATARTDGTNLGQVQDSGAQYSSASGTNAYACGMTPTLSALPDGFTANIYFANANTSAATATLTIDGTATQNLVKNGGALLSPGDIRAGSVNRVVSRGGVYHFFPSSTGAVFGLSDGGIIATASSVQSNFVYMVNMVSGAFIVNFPSTPATGDTLPLTIFGNNVLSMYDSGSKFFGQSGTIQTQGGEGYIVPRYTGTSRGWIW